MSEPKDYVICKRGLFYLPNSCGYTDHIEHAGRYTKTEAMPHSDAVAGVSVHLASEFEPGTEPRLASDDKLPPMWVVYDHPSDHPNSFIARLWRNGTPTLATITNADVDDIRSRLRREGLVCLARDGDDDPVIMEVWI